MALIQSHTAWFHDATLEGIQTGTGQITLDVADARTQSDLPCSVRVALEHVTSIKADGEVADTFFMEAEDGEILSLDLRDDGIVMTLVWHDWKPRRQFTRQYEIKARNVRVVVAV